MMDGTVVRERNQCLVYGFAEADQPEPVVGSYARVVTLDLRKSSSDPFAAVRGNVWGELDRRQLKPSMPAIDLLNLATCVYSADMRVSRRTGYDGWTRDFVLIWPVSDLRLWTGASEAATELLEFLTGDRWDLRPIQAINPQNLRPQVRQRLWAKGTPCQAEGVSLLSGGLDSLIGAIDELEQGRKPVFVSHNTAGSERFTSRSQQCIVAGLTKQFGADVKHIKFRVAPPRAKLHATEDTQRSRSIIFFGLGLLVASALEVRGGGGSVELRVPENGFISLNAALTPSRQGSCSTRTTHPFTMECLRGLCRMLGLGTRIELPYKWQTKGEMVSNTANATLLKKLYQKSNSCSRPNVHKKDASRPQEHCGYCVPCIIRRASLRVAGLDSVKHYRYDLTKERGILEASPDRRSDPRAFAFALLEDPQDNLLRILSSGPLPVDAAALNEYLAVYARGLSEVANLMRA